MKNTYVLALITAIFFCQASSCDDPDPLTTSPEELAEQIRRNTPTELPPITTTGENTMGAWIHPQPGSPLHDLEGDSILFVASGVRRPTVVMAESTSCEAFNNIKKLTTGKISTVGIYCSRKEIDDTRYMSLSHLHAPSDSSEVSFRYQPHWFEDSHVYSSRQNPYAVIEDIVLFNDSTNRILSGVFEATLVNREEPFDTLRITAGRFDVTYGTTP